MSKRSLALSNPKIIKPGVSQTAVEIDYVYFHDDSLTVFTKQGNTISIPITQARQVFINKLEDDVLTLLDQPN